MNLLETPGITPVQLGQTPGLPALRVENPYCHATVSPQGAQLLEFQAKGKAPLLWLSEQAVFCPGKAIRGGIPLCFPWFGPHPQDPAKPAHGFARTRPWQLEKASLGEEGHELVFGLRSDAESLALWPHDFAAELRMKLGKNPRLCLKVRNTGHQPFRFTFAFHSYFPVRDISRASIEGLDGSHCIDQLAASRTPYRHLGALGFAGETDRIYLGTGGHYRIIDAAGGKQTIVAAAGCDSAIAWNPGPEKTTRLADMAPGSWRGMVCVECGNVESDALTVLPGHEAVCGMELEADH